MQVTNILLARFLLIIVSSFMASFYLPVFSDDPGGVYALPVMLVFSFLIVFLINRVFSRRDLLREAVGIELSRLRRVMHIAEQVQNATWRRQIGVAVIEYQRRVAKNFYTYADAHVSFRSITHRIYTYRGVDSREVQLFGELLVTTRDLAYQRQVIVQAIRGHLSSYGWLFMTIISFFQVLLLLLGRFDTFSSRFAAAAGITSALLAIEFLYQFDQMQPQEVNRFQLLYRENILKSKEKVL